MTEVFSCPNPDLTESSAAWLAVVLAIRVWLAPINLSKSEFIPIVTVVILALSGISVTSKAGTLAI